MDPYYFPFQIIDKNNLVPEENYYIKLNDKVIKDFLDKRRNLPVSHLKGTFVRLHKEVSRNSITSEYAVFKNVQIINKNYKIGLCNLMLVQYPDGNLATAGCDTYSDRNRKINDGREVFFSVNKWMFGLPTESSLITKQVINRIIQPSLDPATFNEVGQFRGTGKGGKTRRKKTRGKKRKIYKRNRTKRI